MRLSLHYLPELCTVIVFKFGLDPKDFKLLFLMVCAFPKESGNPGGLKIPVPVPFSRIYNAASYRVSAFHGSSV
jgi:hypothetical protein